MSKTVSRRVRIDFKDDPGFTKSEFAAECNINNIVKKYTKTGVLTHVTSRVASFDDLSDAPSFHEAMNIVASAQQEFDQLPAPVRKRFGNDPASFLDFVHDDSNIDEMVKLGLISHEKYKEILATKEPSTSALLDVTGGTDSKS